ncbi:hypothetical protein O4J56_01050 [Nocardiopsis sp. RSe5-2]|uniref:Uncharacterized protein n=1 Tax=Nocardiopsis endophytica TaxID=3018445 RepID=A0ABT4TY77_9ACTN|nr:hypothetical protein [Nocardiopsis endophytica]MDA2809210.1 hypothetical protein [Nocardiopsis endophytica]
MAAESAKAERPGVLASSADPAPAAASRAAAPAPVPPPSAPSARTGQAAEPPAGGALSGLTAAIGRFGAPAADGKGTAAAAHRPGKPTMALAAIAGLLLVAAPFGASETGMRLAGGEGAGASGADPAAGTAGAQAQAPLAGGAPVVPGEGGGAGGAGGGGGQDPGGFVPDVLPQAPGAVGGEDREDGGAQEGGSGDGSGGDGGDGGGAGGSGPEAETQMGSLLDGVPLLGSDGSEEPGGREGSGKEKKEKEDTEATEEAEGAGGESGSGGGAEGGGSGSGSGSGAPEGGDGPADGPEAAGGADGGKAQDQGATPLSAGTAEGTDEGAGDGGQKREYSAVAGPDCTDPGASYAVHGQGVARTGSGHYTGSGCAGGYDALPVSGDSNAYTDTAATWTFTPGFDDATCSLKMLVIAGESPLWGSGEPANVELFDGARAEGRNRGVYKIERPDPGNYWAVTEFSDVDGAFTLRLTNAGAAPQGAPHPTLPASVVEAECR